MQSTRFRALLLDLDDTLIDNSVETFVPAYLRALEAFVVGVVPPGRIVEELLAATRAMNSNSGSESSNEEIFTAAFYPALGMPREEVEPLLERFYREEFPKLRPLTGARAAAPRVIEWAKTRGLQIAIATNPLFPRAAIEERMAWGGVGVDRFAFDLVTSYENCHATKANPAYYLEILRLLGRRPGECLMVGDNWEWDIVCAARAGIAGYWIGAPASPPPQPAVSVIGRGSLDDFLAAAEGGEVEERLAEGVVRGIAV
jgi:HAD superfamily hydrolase (TIGR01549 family)